MTAVWLLQAVPVRGGAGFGSVNPDDSLFAALARLLAPIFAPLGFGDWHTSSALVVGFVAKEAVITSWAQTYAAADPTAGLPPHELQAHIVGAFQASSAGAVTAAVWAFLIFLLAYTPCVATVAAQKREIGARWTAFGIGMQLGVAWLLAFAVFQIAPALLVSAPLRQVLDALDGGARSRADVCAAHRAARRRDRRRHRPPGPHRQAEREGSSAPAAPRRLRSCASGVDGAPGCGAAAPSPARRGPMLVELSVRPGPGASGRQAGPAARPRP